MNLENMDLTSDPRKAWVTILKIFSNGTSISGPEAAKVLSPYWRDSRARGLTGAALIRDTLAAVNFNMDLIQNSEISPRVKSDSRSSLGYLLSPRFLPKPPKTQSNPSNLTCCSPRSVSVRNSPLLSPRASRGIPV